VALLLSGLSALLAPAQNHEASGRAGGVPTLRPVSSVEGTVSSVSGTVVRVLEDTFAIDVSEAKIFLAGARNPGHAGGYEGSLADIKVGYRILAQLLEPLPMASPLPPVLKARYVFVTPVFGGIVTGTIDGVDASAKSFSMLQHAILTNNETEFGGDAKSFSDLVRGQLAVASLVVRDRALWAVRVEVHNPRPPAPTPTPRQTSDFDITGVLQAIPRIGTFGTWRIADRDILVTPMTKIEGEPKVGDTVEARGTIQNASGASAPLYIATSIEKKSAD
jgi:hypothetical protein